MRKRELEERLGTTEERLKTTERLLGEVSDNYIHVTESLVDLEMARDRVGWLKLGGFDGREFSREFLREIYEDALTSYIKNPLTNHGVEVKGHYVFGQGVTIAGESPEVDKLWQLFWKHPSNRIEFTSYQALFLKEVDLQLEGNLFLALFTAPKSGAVQVRSIHTNEITDIITNPEDSKEPWYYRRVWSERDMSAEGMWANSKEQQALYPAWNYRPKFKPDSFRSKEIKWDAPIYHVKVGGTSHMRFGVTDIYSSLDWAKASKEAMEDYATVRKALARYAYQLTVKGGKEGVAAAKAKLGTTFGEDSGETVPSPLPGSIAIGAEGMAKLEVMRTSGAQSHPDEARMLMVMAAAGLGQPYSILTGDADKSNLATAKSLDRPTELNMQMRRMLWTMIFQDLNTYLLLASIRAPQGVVKGKLIPDEWGTEQIYLGNDKKGEPIPTGLNVDWPPILEHDVSESVKAIVSAATLDGKPDAGILDRETLVRQLASTLGIENIDTLIDKVIADMEAAPPAEETVEETQFVEALKELREVLRKEQE